MPKLRAVVESLDEVEDSCRDYDVESDLDGKTVHVLDLEPDTVRDHPETRALKNALDRQKSRVSELQQKVTAAEEKAQSLPEDFDADEWEKLKELKEQVESGDHDKKRQADLEQVYEAKLARERDALQKQIDEQRQENERIRATNHRLVRDQALDSAIEKASIAPRHRKLVRAFLEDHVRALEGDDGEIRVVAVTEYDDETPLDKFVSTWAETDEGRLYVEQPTGADARGSKTTRSKKANPFSRETWSLTEQTRLVRENIDEARRLAKEAGAPANF